jgi:hypothetical protein
MKKTRRKQIVRGVLCLSVLTIVFALLLSGNSRSAIAFADYDQDGVPAGPDCNDFNPTIAYDADDDLDGFTICQGDCADDDPTIHKCAESHRQYPVIYNPPETPCHTGFTVHTKAYHCWYVCGVQFCESEPFMEYDTDYLKDCF